MSKVFFGVFLHCGCGFYVALKQSQICVHETRFAVAEVGLKKLARLMRHE